MCSAIYLIALVAALPKEGRKIFVTGAVYLVTGHKIAPVGQARRTGIPIAKALRAGIFATSDEYTQREPTGVNEYDEPMPQAGFDPDPSTLRCPICFDTVCRPVVTLCLHVFCDECIYKSLRDSSLACPLCRASIPQPPEPDAILEGYLERAVAEGVVAVPSGGSSPYAWEVRKRRHKIFFKKKLNYSSTGSTVNHYTRQKEDLKSPLDCIESGIGTSFCCVGGMSGIQMLGRESNRLEGCATGLDERPSSY
ncbi:hypothetical protein B0H13DRAFT_1872342 [Mycena leptocephala]|nr:hypothetical protein B0H13DRAFT_1872342 [Mycena leptocephala]